MYDNVMVAVDNSPCSNHAIDLAVELARTTGARLTGVHVYAARLHDTRFRQLEPGLPHRYQQEEILQHQRDIHGDLIGRGLRIVSDSYLAAFEEKCGLAGVTCVRKTPEGRNYDQLVRDTRESKYDLVVIGAYGLGRVDRSLLGSVCERVARLVDCDVLVVRNSRPLASDRILVAIDGSTESFAALDAGLSLGQAFGTRVGAVAAYDPFFHRVAFQSVARVLSDEDSKLFRFKEQEKLHDEIIDDGLLQVYRAHLNEAQRLAETRGMSLEVDVLEGKPFDVIASHVSASRPALLVVGRTGIHHVDGVTLGSSAENLLRCADSNVLVVSQGRMREASNASSGEVPPVENAIRWSPEAEKRLERVPFFARRMARKGIERYARENGHDEVTPEVYEQARRRFGMGRQA